MREDDLKKARLREVEHRKGDLDRIKVLQTELENVYEYYRDNLERNAMQGEDYRATAIEYSD